MRREWKLGLKFITRSLFVNNIVIWIGKNHTQKCRPFSEGGGSRIILLDSLANKQSSCSYSWDNNWAKYEFKLRKQWYTVHSLSFVARERTRSYLSERNSASFPERYSVWERLEFWYLVRDEKFRSEGDDAYAPLCAAPIGGHDPLSCQSLQWSF